MAKYIDTEAIKVPAQVSPEVARAFAQIKIILDQIGDKLNYLPLRNDDGDAVYNADGDLVRTTTL